MIPLRIEKLAPTRKIRAAAGILQAGLDAADPTIILRRHVKADAILHGDSATNPADYDRVYTVAFGKAAYSMSRAVYDILPVQQAMVVLPHPYRPPAPPSRFRIYTAGHPVPDYGSVTAAKAVIKFLRNRRGDDLVVFLVSGGASSLLALPDDITLADKMRTTDMLVKCGATISEINCIRKHISGIKGGKLLERMPCGGVSLVMSDVEGDDPAAIASGTTYMDSTTYDDALEVVARYDLDNTIPEMVMQRLQRGAAGAIPETPKIPHIPYGIVANNGTCLDAMEEAARRRGYRTGRLHIYTDVAEATDTILNRADSGTCLVFGGEPTIRVRGRGRGGRNQELVLRLHSRLRAGQVAASMGTDGIDGNTTAAGAVCQGPGDGSAYLKDNDSHSYFERYGGLVRTGPTHTNLLDIGVVLG